ncbi:hypothetical protein KKE47_04235, partial [Patescibacteria group bacterium]|nr:hypothetical protein [Patescibacteria group bacterium]
SLLVMKEVERMLEPTKISLIKAIQILGKVGQGEVVFGKLKTIIDSELSNEAKTIYRQIPGH